ncbi:MAG: L,D-transpeptidase family protein [Brumimicrobium sp.]
MRKILLLFTTSLLLAFILPSDFLDDQKRYKRVRVAIDEKEDFIDKKLNERGLELNNFHLLMVAYKASDELELFVKKKSEEKYQRLITYDICAKSGELGPKRKQGDGQVPEGFYHIDRFNPSSSFYLSLGINYPNQSDKLKSNASDLGGDIFIHGSCVTIGCLPMTTDKIKEIYLYAVHAKNNGQSKIPVYIYPYRMTEINNMTYFAKYNHEEKLLKLWKNLKTGFDDFEKHGKAFDFKVDSAGNYKF